MMKNPHFCAHRRTAPVQGLTTRQWGLELPLQDTATVATSKPAQGKKEDGK